MSATSLSPAPAKALFLSDALTVSEPFPMTRDSERGVVVGMCATLVFWLGVALAVWALF